MSGVVDLEYETNRQRGIHKPNYVVAQAVFNHWVHGLQRGLEAETWADYFFSGYAMKFERARGWESFRKEPGFNTFHRGWLETIEVSNPHDVAMLSVKYARFPAEGNVRFTYKQTNESTMYLTLKDLRSLREACDALLNADSNRRKEK